MAESDKPSARYTTSEMAKDALELLDSVGWTGKRQLNIIGVSMGGMIAQELVRWLAQIDDSLLMLTSIGVDDTRENSISHVCLDSCTAEEHHSKHSYKFWSLTT